MICAPGTLDRGGSEKWEFSIVGLVDVKLSAGSQLVGSIHEDSLPSSHNVSAYGIVVKAILRF
jgi:hypothetical protein